MPRSIVDEIITYPGMENWPEYLKPVKVVNPANIDADEVTPERIAADIEISDLCKATKQKYAVNPLSGERLPLLVPDWHFSPTLAASTILSSMKLAISEEEKDSPKSTIYWWNGKRWLADGERIITGIVDGICGDLSYDKGIREMFRRIRANIDILRFDADLNVINLRNGRFNWKTREFIPHSADDPYPALIQYPIMFDPEAKCPRINKIIANITPNPAYQRTLKEWVAYCFYRSYPIQKSLWLYGEGGTGKSTFTEIEDALFGKENTSGESLDKLANNRFSAMDLKNKSRCNCGETPATEMKNTTLFKKLTGRDLISGEKKFKDVEPFYNFAKIECMINEMRKTADKTSGFYRRILIIPFDHKFTDEEKRENAKLLEAIKDPKELAGFFNEVIALLPNLIESKCFAFNPTDMQIAKMVTRLSEPIETFINVCIIQDSDEKTGKEFLYEKYVEFSRLNKTPVKDKSYFDKCIRDLDCVDRYTGQHKKKENGKVIPAWPNIEFNHEGLEWFEAERSKQKTW